MLINMELKNRLAENPSRSGKAEFVKNFESRLANVPTRNLLCFGGTIAFQCTRTMLTNCATKSRAMAPLLPRVLSDTGIAETLFSQYMVFLTALLEPFCLSRVNSSPNSVLHFKQQMDQCQKALFKRLIKAS
jgi:hypothetical protein